MTSILLDLRQQACVEFRQSDENLDGASDAQGSCGVAYIKNFVVKPAKNEITSISSANGAFKISWKKGTAGTTGYQVLYSKDKNFKNDVHSYTSTKLSDLSENFSNVPKSGETWYVKVRSFFTKDGKVTSTRYGNYSDVRSIKVK